MSDPSPFVQWTLNGLGGVISLMEMYVRDGGTLSKERLVELGKMQERLEALQWNKKGK